MRRKPSASGPARPRSGASCVARCLAASSDGSTRSCGRPSCAGSGSSGSPGLRSSGRYWERRSGLRSIVLLSGRWGTRRWQRSMTPHAPGGVRGRRYAAPAAARFASAPQAVRYRSTGVVDANGSAEVTCPWLFVEGAQRAGVLVSRGNSFGNFRNGSAQTRSAQINLEVCPNQLLAPPATGGSAVRRCTGPAATPPICGRHDEQAVNTPIDLGRPSCGRRHGSRTARVSLRSGRSILNSLRNELGLHPAQDYSSPVPGRQPARYAMAANAK